MSQERLRALSDRLKTLEILAKTKKSGDYLRRMSKMTFDELYDELYIKLQSHKPIENNGLDCDALYEYLETIGGKQAWREYLEDLNK